MGKIIIINHYGITPDLPGATKHYEMAKYFAENSDYNVEFWICGYNHHTGNNHESLKKCMIQTTEKNDGFKTIRIKSTPYRNNAFARQLNISVFDLITSIKLLFSTKIDLVIISNPPVSVFNVIISKIRKLRIIADIEDLWPLFLIDMGLTNKIAISYMEFFSNFLYKVSDEIIAVSNGMVNYVKDRVEPSKNVNLIPLGVNLEEYEKHKIDENLINGKKWSDKFKIMYIGAHGKANDLSSVLKSIAEFNRISSNFNEIAFVFIGDGDQKKPLVDQSKELKLENVYFESAIASNLVPAYILHADICLTNLQKIDSFKLVRPNKLFQYMALGKPIVSGIVGEAKDIIESADSGYYVDFNETKSAALNLMKIIDEKEKLKNMGLNGRKYVKEHGDRAQIFRKLLEIVEKNIRS